MTHGMGADEKLGVLRQFVQNGASAFLVFKIVDGFQNDWKNVNKLFDVISPLLGSAMEDEDNAESEVIARVIAHCCQMSDAVSDIILREYMQDVFR